MLIRLVIPLTAPAPAVACPCISRQTRVTGVRHWRCQNTTLQLPIAMFPTTVPKTATAQIGSVHKNIKRGLLFELSAYGYKPSPDARKSFQLNCSDTEMLF